MCKVPSLELEPSTRTHPWPRTAAKAPLCLQRFTLSLANNFSTYQLPSSICKVTPEDVLMWKLDFLQKNHSSGKAIPFQSIKAEHVAAVGAEMRLLQRAQVFLARIALPLCRKRAVPCQDPPPPRPQQCREGPSSFLPHSLHFKAFGKSIFLITKCSGAT